MAKPSNMQRIVISLDTESLLDLKELAYMMSLGGSPNISETIRRLARWALCNPEHLTKMPMCLPSRKYQTKPETQPEPIKQDDSRSTLPAIVIDKEQTCSDTWDWPGVEKP